MAEQFTLDKATILDRLGGDEEIFSLMAGMYLDEVENYCSQIAAALAAGDASVLQREAHTIKSLLANFADGSGAALAQAVESRAKAGDLAGLEPQVADIQARLRLVGAALQGQA